MEQSSKSYPIAEVFVAPQGEGLYTGTSMCFLRFAGCTVGKPYSKAEREQFVQLGQTVQYYQERCTAWDGQSFACDTNYRMSQRLTVQQIAALPEVFACDRICLTGGEPLMHDLMPLMQLLWFMGKSLHLETSGTIDFSSYTTHASRELTSLWVTVSPKSGYLHEALLGADEIKILVNDNFSENAFLENFGFLLNNSLRLLWIQPVNSEWEVDMNHVQRCLELQQKYSQLRLSIQLHKIIKTR